MHTAKGKSNASSSTTQGRNSSSSSLPKWDYEVFLSFRGEDTRKNFTDHLYNALIDHGIHTFRDNEGLPIGEKIGPALRSAIHRSKIAIPIFSKDYASSKWCLRELAEIVKCMKRDQRKIIVKPVFYPPVDPSDVRNQTGIYKKAFRNHQKEFGQETEVWKKAMKEVGELKGWHMEKIADGHEGELIKLIVKEVWSELRKSPLIAFDDLVGIHFHVEEVMKLLNIGANDTRIVGIHGLGGLGKTTIARCVYKTIYHHFDGCSFIANARETFRLRGSVHLQSQLIVDILNLKDNPNITSVEQGIHMITKRLSNKKALIVLDDVDQTTCLNEIIGTRDWFGNGSKIIITTRDKHILNVHEVDETYEPKVMNLDHSIRLFSKHAFKMDQPPKQCLALSMEVVESTGRLPLALEVIGSLLFGRGASVKKGLVENFDGMESVLKAMVKKLKEFPNEEVQKKLRISFDELGHTEKQMFLDVACFFIGMDKTIACYIWDGCNFFPGLGFDVLHQKSLVKIGENNELIMHDLLRDLGREIVRQEDPKELGKRSRLWSLEALEVWHTKMGAGEVEGLDFRGLHGQTNLMSEGLAAMTDLRLLRLNDYVVVSGDFMHSFSELRWLCWRGCRDIQFSQFNPKKLTVLNLSYGDITESWTVWRQIKVAENLKFLDLTSCQKLSQTPDLSANQQLEVLILELCVNLAKVDVGHLKRLVVLNMKHCQNLKCLPASICELRCLEKLDIGFTSIHQLPENLGNLETLKELLIDRTCIEWLPDSIGRLRKLKILSAKYCNIQEGGIPDVIGRLSSLEILILDDNQFHTLPATISNLSLLQTLSLSYCVNLQSLPQLPSSLTSLDASRCPLESFPINVPQGLESLDLSRCFYLQHIPHLPSSLKILKVDCMWNLREISFCSDMRNLVTLCLNDCFELAKIESYEGLDSVHFKDLVCLEVQNCHKLSEIPGLEGMDCLRELNLKCCRSLGNIQIPKKLRKLFIQNCWSLSEIEGVTDLLSLEEITIRCSPIVDLSSLKNLKHLQLFRCDQRILPDLSNLNMLNRLQIEYCEELTEIPGVDRLESLEVFKVYGCKSMEILPDLSNLTKLRELRIERCQKLTEIQGADKMEILEVFKIDECISIETIPCLSKLKKLKILSLVDCGELTEIQGADELESLEELHIDGCISIVALPSLSKLKNLKILSTFDCREITEIQGADELESLEELRIDNCFSIQTLPSLSKLKKLKFLSAHDCRKLTAIHGVDELDSLLKLCIDNCISLRKSSLSTRRQKLIYTYTTTKCCKVLNFSRKFQRSV